ncbi:MAG: hypothetical protein AB2417_05850 [Clostridiaceae bacterium]
MTKKSCFIILGIAFGLLTKVGIKNAFPQVKGTPYVALMLLSLVLIVIVLTFAFRLSDKIKEKIKCK